MEIRSHRLEGVPQREGFCDERPDPDIDLIVIHGISLPAGHFGGNYVEGLFCGCLDTARHPDLRDLEGVCVSSHLFIRRDGGMIQFVPFDRRAWHAGESQFKGRTRCNDFSIGIELEGTDGNRYREAQYRSLIEVSRLLVDAYGIPPGHVVGHSDIAPGRKTDPGPYFDWNRLLDAIGH
ncbi:MAG: 1,6-anhydro-N-acetylmuramyl-L-alanine amidase AmpD [Gammaproteobacteria bacterium]|nr:1,6-anhydro-N-acetylmuramyl-L-alanine amidase AmpD [Gammaproteobacteria bacterium]